MIRLQRDYPKTRSINGVIYTIKFRRKLASHWPVTFGLCHYDKKVIEIKTGLSPEFRHEVFWHEVLHAISYEHGIRLAHPTIYNLQGPLSKFMTENGY